MKDKRNLPSGLQDLCRKLKLQLEELNLQIDTEPALPDEEKERRNMLMEQLKRQLSELSL